MAKCRLLLALCSVLAVCCQPSLSQVSTEDKPACRGVFDFVFVVDSSKSLSEEYQSDIVPFVVSVSQNFINPNFRLSLITFSELLKEEVHLPLTPISDQTKIQEGIEKLKNVVLGGGTFLSGGLRAANNQIQMFGGDAASVILILTDGIIDDLDAALIQANIARSRDSRIFAVGVQDAREDQLIQIVDDEHQLFVGGDFAYLQTVIEKVINETCVEITTVEPSQICFADLREGRIKQVTLNGKGFHSILDEEKALCRFKTVDGQYLSGGLKFIG